MPLWRPGEQLCSWYPSRLLDGSSWPQAVEARKPQLSDPMGKLPPRLPFHFIVVFTVVHPAHRHQPVPGSPGSECDTDLPQLALEVGVTLTYPLAVWKWVWPEHVEWPEKAFVLTWIFQSKIVVRYTRVFFFSFSITGPRAQRTVDHWATIPSPLYCSFGDEVPFGCLGSFLTVKGPELRLPVSALGSILRTSNKQTTKSIGRPCSTDLGYSDRAHKRLWVPTPAP